MHNPIVFPDLGISIDPAPTINIPVFGHTLSIHWYGVIIAVGFVLGVLYVIKTAKKSGISEDTVLDFILIAAPLSIIGARAYYVIFNPSQFHSFYDAIAIWHGGIAIYGAIIAGIITCVVFCRKRKIPIFKFLDIAVLGLMIGQIIGRWGNFINREAYGGICDLPWRMEIYSHIFGGRVPVHPTFIYESIWNLIGFVILHFYSKRKKRDGEIALLYIGWYGFGRTFIEGLRSDSLYFLGTGIRISQLVGIVSVIFAVVALTLLYKGKSIRLKKGGTVKVTKEESSDGKNN